MDLTLMSQTVFEQNIFSINSPLYQMSHSTKCLFFQLSYSITCLRSNVVHSNFTYKFAIMHGVNWRTMEMTIWADSWDFQHSGQMTSWRNRTSKYDSRVCVRVSMRPMCYILACFMVISQHFNIKQNMFKDQFSVEKHFRSI